MADESRIKVQLHRKDRTDEQWIPLTTGGCVQLTDYENDGTAELPITIGSEEAYDTLNTALAKLENGLSGFADVARTGDFNDLINTPEIPEPQLQSDWGQSDSTAVDFIKNKPAVNDSTVTINVNGAQLDTFTLNQASDKTINIPVPENPVIFKGTVNTTGINGTTTPLPVADASNNGHEYKVSEDGTYRGVASKVGDVLISNGQTWVNIPSGDEPSGTVIEITATNGVKTGDGNAITTTGVIELDPVHQSAPGAKGDTTNQTPTYGGTFKVPSLTVDVYGRVTAVAEHTVQIPASDNTDTTVDGVSHHYTPTADATAEITAVGGTAGAYAKDTEYSVVTGVKAQRDAAGHVVGLTTTRQVVKDTDTVYTHPTTSGNKHVPSGGASGDVLKWSADGTAAWGSPDHQTVNIYAGGASSTANAATTDGNTYIIIKGASSTTQKIKVVGSDVSVTSDANGVITIDASGKADKQVDATFSSTSLTIKSGYNYTATTALSSLTLTYDSTNKADKSAAQSASNKLGTGDLETNIVFTVSGSSFTLTPPSGTNIVTPEYVDSIPTWESGKKYIVSVYKGLFVFGEISSSWS